MNPEEQNGRIGSRDHAQERKQHRAEIRVAKEQERKRKYEEEQAAQASLWSAVPDAPLISFSIVV